MWQNYAAVLRHPFVVMQIENLKRERNLLDRLRNPGIIRLHFTFQDQDSLYFGLELCPNGVAPELRYYQVYHQLASYDRGFVSLRKSP